MFFLFYYICSFDTTATMEDHDDSDIHQDIAYELLEMLDKKEIHTQAAQAALLTAWLTIAKLLGWSDNKITYKLQKALMEADYEL